MTTPRKDPKDYLKMGRPTKYNPSVMCPRIIEIMTKGYTLEEVCADLGISEETLSKWRKRYPDIVEALKQGKTLQKAWWVKTGREGIHAEKFNALPWIFSMKNMFGWRDKTDLTSDNQKIDQSTKIANIYAIAESDMARLLTEKLKDDTKQP